MRWNVTRLVAGRELRDLSRDRRTVFLLLGLPVIIYPVFGGIGLLLALTFLGQSSTVGVVGLDEQPAPVPRMYGRVPPASWLVAAADPGFGTVVAAAALYGAAQQATDFPPAFEKQPDGSWHFANWLGGSPDERRPMTIVPLSAGRADVALAEREVDLVVRLPAGLYADLAAGRQPTVGLASRPGDERSKVALSWAQGAIGVWRNRVRQVRFLRAGFPSDFDKPVTIDDPQAARPLLVRSGDDIRDALVKCFPFILVMWALAGALHPAIDVCAGEKERGTMETLLISPADRAELVTGKFLAVWAFSVLTVEWNLVWLGGGLMVGNAYLPFHLIRPAGLVWGAVLVLPLAGLFSALSMALGVYARSSKEGQYYLLPLFALVMPLMFFSMTPGLRLGWGLCLVPVTGVSLLLQRLMAPEPEAGVVWYLPAVLASLGVCVALALRLAVWQFQRESVLFRNSDRLDLGGRLRRWWGRPGPAAGRG